MPVVARRIIFFVALLGLGAAILWWTLTDPPAEQPPRFLLIIVALISALGWGGWMTCQYITQKQRSLSIQDIYERRFRNLVEGSIQGILVLRGKSILFANQAYADIYGYPTPTELPTLEHFSALIAPPDRERVLAFGRARLAGEPAPSRYEYQGQRKDGSCIWVETQVRLIDWAGDPAIQMTVLDLTERKRAQRALQDAHDTLEKQVQDRTASLQTVNTIADALYRPLDFPTMANRAVEAIAQYLPTASIALLTVESEANILRLQAARGFPAEFGPQTTTLPIDQSLAGLAVSQKQVLESNLFTHDPRTYAPIQNILITYGYKQELALPILFQNEALGAIIVMLKNDQPFTPDTSATLLSIGKSIGLALSNAQYVSQLKSEIDERQNAETALKQSEERYRTLVDGSISSIAVFNHQGTCLFANQTLVTLLGYDRAHDLVGMKASQVIVESDVARIQSYDPTRWQQRPEPLRYECRIAHKDGTHINVEVLETRTSWNTTPATQATFTNITAQRQLEQEVLSVSERERQRLGQDLHDGLGQQLTGLMFLGSGLERKLRADRHAEEAATVSQLNTLLKGALDQAHDLAHSFYPVVLESAGLAAALADLAAHTESLYGMVVTFESDLLCQALEPEVSIHLYRIAQEAITNAAKHGKARRVNLQLIQKPMLLRLQIDDQGTGLPAVIVSSSGIGMRSMYYRARLIGAILTIGPNPQGGARVTCELPL